MRDRMHIGEMMMKKLILGAIAAAASAFAFAGSNVLTVSCFSQFRAHQYEAAYAACEKADAQDADSGIDFALGYMLANGYGTERDEVKAGEYFKTAADAGDYEAAYNLGLMYRNGKGVRQDKRKAAEYFLQAAKSGQPIAAFNLAVMMSNGDGVAKDEKGAITWYKTAVRGGYAAACLNIGTLYANGVAGAMPDLVEASAWFKAAVSMAKDNAQLAKTASGNAQNAAKFLNDKQVSQAEKRANEILAGKF